MGIRDPPTHQLPAHSSGPTAGAPGPHPAADPEALMARAILVDGLWVDPETGLVLGASLDFGPVSYGSESRIERYSISSADTAIAHRFTTRSNAAPEPLVGRGAGGKRDQEIWLARRIAARLYLAGHGANAVARIMGQPLGTVRRWLSSMGLQPQDRGSEPLTEEERTQLEAALGRPIPAPRWRPAAELRRLREQALALHASGASIYAIARQLGVSTHLVWRWVKTSEG